MTSTKPISCLIVDDESMAREILISYIEKVDNMELVASCSSAIEAFKYISNTAIDLVFLDINMPEISGIAFARSINTDVKIIFTTAFRDYAVEGFELRAVDYLLKPISFERFLKGIDAYFEICTPTIIQAEPSVSTNDFIFVRSERRMIKVDFEAIVFVESYSDYIKIHMAKKTIVTRETISAIEAKLPQRHFIRIHRSYIIALEAIESYTHEYVVIAGQTLPISRSYKKEVRDWLERQS